MDRKVFLKSIEIFKNFSSEGISRLAENLEEEERKTGENIFSEGDPGKDLYIIVEGEVVISKRISPETEKVLAVLGPKSVFGETSLFSNVPRTADAKAKSALKYLRAGRDAIQETFAVDTAGTRKTLESFLLTNLERMEQTSRELAAVYEISKVISENPGIREFSQKALNQISHAIPAVHRSALYIWNEFSEEYELASSFIVPEARPQETCPQKECPDEFKAGVPNDHPLVKYLLSNKQETAIIEDSTAIKENFSGIVPQENIGGLIVTPLYRENNLLGFILLTIRAKTIKYGARMRDLMNSLSAQIVNTIVNVRNKEEETARERLNRARDGSISL